MDRKKSSLPQEGQLGAPCWTGKSFFFKERECIEFIYCQYYPPTRGCNFQFTSALEKRMAIHYLKSGWIGKYAPLSNLHPLTLEIASRGVFSNTFLLSAVYYYNTSSNVSWGPPWVTKNEQFLKLCLFICVSHFLCLKIVKVEFEWVSNLSWPLGVRRETLRTPQNVTARTVSWPDDPV